MKYRKKPVVVDVIRFNKEEWLHKKEEAYPMVETVESITRNTKQGTYVSYQPVIRTLEGDMLVSHGDYIIKGVQGEFYPCKPDIFEATYELVEKEIIEQTDQA